jgi:hypothetical protein
MRQFNFFRLEVSTPTVTKILTTVAAQFSGGGTGTEQDPYKIVTAADLDAVRNYTGAAYAGVCFLLMNDIDLSGYLGSDPEGWLPIGRNEVDPFAGHFDGNGHEIKGLRINQNRAVSYLYTGLFGFNTGTISDLGISGGIVVGTTSGSYSCAGSLIGLNRGFVTNCYVTGDVSVFSSSSYYSYSGGLIGYNEGSVTNCYATVNASAIFATSSDYFFSDGFIGGNSGSVNNCNKDIARAMAPADGETGINHPESVAESLHTNPIKHAIQMFYTKINKIKITIKNEKNDEK